MAATTENVIIFGATGLIGRHITEAVINAQPPFKRTAVFTSQGTVENKAAQIKALKEQGVEICVGDITDDSAVLKAYEGFDTVISAVGRNVIAEQISLIKLAESSPSIKRFFPSEYGTDIKYDETSAAEKPHQQKLKVRAYVESDAVTKLQYTYLVTGPYSDLYIGKSSTEEKAGTFDVKAKKAVLLGDGEGKVSFTTMRDVGKLLVAAIQHPEASRNRALKVNSFTATPNEIIEEFKHQTGDDEWTASYTPLPELERLEQEAWTEGKPYAPGITLRRIWTQGKTMYEKRDNGLIGEPETDTLQTAVSQAIQAQL